MHANVVSRYSARQTASSRLAARGDAGGEPPDMFCVHTADQFIAPASECVYTIVIGKASARDRGFGVSIHIEQRRTPYGVQAYLRGTRVAVRHVAAFLKAGRTAEEIIRIGLPHLPPASIYEAIAYYYEIGRAHV